MSILQTLEKISFKTIIGASVVIVIAVAIPLTVWVSQKQTQLEGRAFFEKPEVIKPVKKFGAPSQGEPHIGLVWPFLGKIGDVVLIEGANFGDNPQNKRLSLGNQLVTESNIVRWTPTLIEFVIPTGSISSYLNLQVASKPASWPYLFTIYSLDTKIKVTENNDIVRVLNSSAGTKMEIYFSDGTKIESTQVEGTPVPGDKTILTVVIKNKDDSPIPFYVEPDEFGF